jgi:hypothetical protein
MSADREKAETDIRVNVPVRKRVVNKWKQDRDLSPNRSSHTSPAISAHPGTGQLATGQTHMHLAGTMSGRKINFRIALCRNSHPGPANRKRDLATSLTGTNVAFRDSTNPIALRGIESVARIKRHAARAAEP